MRAISRQSRFPEIYRISLLARFLRLRRIWGAGVADIPLRLRGRRECRWLSIPARGPGGSKTRLGRSSRAPSAKLTIGGARWCETGPLSASAALRKDEHDDHRP